MPGIVKTRIFDHKRYNLLLSGVDKAKAMRNAAYVREHGGMARIRPTSGKGPFAGYDLWTRDTKK